MSLRPLTEAEMHAVAGGTYASVAFVATLLAGGYVPYGHRL